MYFSAIKGNANLSIFISQGFCNILSQTWWVRKTEIYFLPVREAGGLKSRCPQSRVFLESKACSMFLSLLLVVPGSPWSSLAYGWINTSKPSKNWCFWTAVLEKSLESPLDCEELQPVHPKGNQSWIFIGRTDVEAETPILWPPDVKNWLIGKDPDAGKDWRWEEKGKTEDEMVHMSLSKLQEFVDDREAWRAAVHGVTKSQTWQGNWTELKPSKPCLNLHIIVTL